MSDHQLIQFALQLHLLALMRIALAFQSAPVVAQLIYLNLIPFYPFIQGMDFFLSGQLSNPLVFELSAQLLDRGFKL